MEELVYLRALETSDIERTHRWHCDAELYESLVGVFHFVSKTSEQKWLEEKTRYSPNEFNLAICLRESQMHIGNIYVRSIDWVYRHAIIGILIGEADNRSKGYGQSALRQIITHSFQVLGLHKLILEVLEDNPRAIHVYEKSGFKIEGTMRKHVYKKGIWKDLIIMGILREEWTEFR